MSYICKGKFFICNWQILNNKQMHVFYALNTYITATRTLQKDCSWTLIIGFL